MAATVIPLRRPQPPTPAEAADGVPPEARALAALLAAIPDPALRDWCAAQLRAAASPDEAADALALARALGRGAGPVTASAAELPVLRVAGGCGTPLPADIGQGPAEPRRGSLSAQRKRKLPCIATSSSP